MKDWIIEQWLTLDTLIIVTLAVLLFNLFVMLYIYWKEKENQRKYFDREL